ncbi:MAG: hypothetical protein QME12_04270 [Nanoarchaeota archaeon]|nr:hypothetical protein [Nanoarchaeota archaeon]
MKNLVLKKEFEELLEESGLKKEFLDFLKDIDMERAEKANKRLEGKPITPESFSWLENESWFGGDWDRHIAWVKQNGSEEQKREDIPLLEKMREKERKGELEW